MSKRISGYDPVTKICWGFNNPGEDHWSHRAQCPACSSSPAERELFFFGRCRSGKRWFWVATCCLFQKDETKEKIGWEDSEESAVAAAMTSVHELRSIESLVIAGFNQRSASQRLKELNAEKRRQRPAPDTSDARAIEYLYGHTFGGEDLPGHPVRFRITRRTARRIYYIRQEERLDIHGEPENSQNYVGEDRGIGYVNRQKLEADGSVYNRGVHWCRSDWHLYPSLEALFADRYQHECDEPDLQQLKADMAAAHPDRGGSSAAFIAARAAYVEARRKVRHMRSEQ